jgi:hypothetical protein
MILITPPVVTTKSTDEPGTDRGFEILDEERPCGISFPVKHAPLKRRATGVTWWFDRRKSRLPGRELP